MQATIRQAVESDWEVLKELRLRALQDAPLAFGSTYAREVAFDEQTWRERIAGTTTLLADVDGRTVGTATGFPDPDDPGTMFLFGMYVDPAARGHGIAAALLEQVIAAARVQGRPRILLHVVEDNTVARGLYERRGFRPTGRTAGLPHTPEVREIELELSRLSTDPASVIEPVSDPV